MDLELATIGEIAEELSKRGRQFIIALEVIDSDPDFKLQLCTDGNKNQEDVARAIIRFFGLSEVSEF